MSFLVDLFFGEHSLSQIFLPKSYLPEFYWKYANHSRHAVKSRLSAPVKIKPNPEKL